MFDFALAKSVLWIGNTPSPLGAFKATRQITQVPQAHGFNAVDVQQKSDYELNHELTFGLLRCILSNVKLQYCI